MVHKFIMLMFGHYLFDFALQNQFIAEKKGKDWYVLFAHSFLHAGWVLIITDNPFWFLLELISHCILDLMKCKGKIDMGKDQLGHISLKLVYLFC